MNAPTSNTDTNVPAADLDAVELEIFKHLFASIAEEMGVRLMRSAYSPNIKERRDFSCALFDAQGDMIAQAAHIPVHLGSAPLSVKAVLQAFPPAAMRPGERFIVNDPFAGGTHLPDITVIAPCFVPGFDVPLFFSANRAHHADVGGITPGSLPISRHIDEEGVRIPPSRLTDTLMEEVCRQTRTPDERRGDLLAQCAAVDVGLGRLGDLAAHHGPRRLAACGAALQQYTARFVRQVIAELPDGVYRFQDVLDDDGHGQTDIAIRCTLTIKGDRASVDLRDSDDQVAGPVNAVRAIALSAVMYVFRCLAPAQIPSNSGVLLPVEVLTRPGSVVDAQYPSPVAGGNVETSQRIVDVLFGAVALALPDRAPAASCGSMNNLTLGGYDTRGGQHAQPPFAYYETLAGGAGAGPGADGGSAIHTHMTNTRNTPVEAIEHSYPFRVEAYRIRRGSGGAGAHRGGEGVVRRYVFQTAVQVTLLTERRRHAPYGLAGGEPGTPGRNVLMTADGRQRELPGKCTIALSAGDALEIHTPGGGGWGAPVPGRL
ncbi:MAG: hydantoinase B/oxoprolinase family protein [Phycisphaeraceae bacterium]